MAPINRSPVPRSGVGAEPPFPVLGWGQSPRSPFWVGGWGGAPFPVLSMCVGGEAEPVRVAGLS